jgi:hypothetical protein
MSSDTIGPDAADRIEQLEQENAILEKRLKEIQNMCLGYQEEHAELGKDAERYRWFFKGDKVYSQFIDLYQSWDGQNGKAGFDRTIDEVMK